MICEDLMMKIYMWGTGKLICKVPLCDANGTLVITK